MKPRLVEKGCWNCKYGHIPLADSRTCCRCLTGKSQWRKKPSRKKQEER